MVCFLKVMRWNVPKMFLYLLINWYSWVLSRCCSAYMWTTLLKLRVLLDLATLLAMCIEYHTRPQPVYIACMYVAVSLRRRVGQISFDLSPYSLVAVLVCRRIYHRPLTISPSTIRYFKAKTCNVCWRLVFWVLLLRNCAFFDSRTVAVIKVNGTWWQERDQRSVTTALISTASNLRIAWPLQHEQHQQ